MPIGECCGSHLLLRTHDSGLTSATWTFNNSSPTATVPTSDGYDALSLSFFPALVSYSLSSMLSMTVSISDSMLSQTMDASQSNTGVAGTTPVTVLLCLTRNHNK